MIYRGMDQAALDREYSPSSMIPDLEAYLSSYATRSLQARTLLDRNARSGLRYGAKPRQTLDYFAVEKPRRPLFIFIHGGYWGKLDKSSSSYVAPAFIQEDVNVAVLNYSLAPAARLDEIVDDIRSGLRWIFHNVSSLGHDPQRVTIGGHSAGAHLCAMMLASEWAGECPIAAAVLLCGIYDLEPIRLSYVNSVLHLDEPEAQRNSPLRLIPKLQCPVAIMVAENDTAEFKRQSYELSVAWSSYVPDLSFRVLNGLNHFDAPLEWTQRSSQLFRESLRLVGANPDTI